MTEKVKQSRTPARKKANDTYLNNMVHDFKAITKEPTKPVVIASDETPNMESSQEVDSGILGDYDEESEEESNGPMNKGFLDSFLTVNRLWSVDGK